jgi:hypothetical protein
MQSSRGEPEILFSRAFLLSFGGLVIKQPIALHAPDAAERWVPDPSYMGKGLQLRFMVEDEGAFTTPWSATITYRRPPLTEWREFICAENRQEYYRGRETGLPTAHKPDF